jgi:hypothetical protein
MRFSRRRFLVAAGGLVAAASGFITELLRPFGLRAARAEALWSVRPATLDDLAAMRDIFNAQLDAGLFPFADRIERWSAEKAARLLETYTGTLVLERDGAPAGFVALIDYTAPETQSSIAPDAEPEVKILAVCVDRLTQTERLLATKHLALAASRDLVRQGFSGCEATIHARTGFQNLFAEQMEVREVSERDGVPEAKVVRFRIGEVVEQLELQGL